MNDQIKQEYEKQFKVIKVKGEKEHWFNTKPSSDEVWSFISSKLNQVRKETAESLRLQEKPISNIFKDNPYLVIAPSKDIRDYEGYYTGYNQAVSELNTKIDEFIKSMEEGHGK